jgi:hypothetical protein
VSRSLRRGAVAALIIATAPILAACSAGAGAASLQVKPDSAATSIGSTLKLNGIAVVAATDGSANANITTNISNTSSAAETLQSVSVDGTAATLSGPAIIPAGGSLLLGGPGQVTATVSSLTETPGQNATLTFTFATAGSVTVPALVNAGTGIYASFAPATATPTPTVSAPASSKAAEKAKAKVSEKASGKASEPASPNSTATLTP